METTNCKDCGALVYVTDVPSKKTGNCWRCEVKRLKSVDHAFKSQKAANLQLVQENEQLKEELATAKKTIDGHCYALFETCYRMQLIVMYYGTPEVQAAVDAFLGDYEDGMDWFNPPPAVDENLEKLEHFKASLRKMVPERFPESEEEK